MSVCRVTNGVTRVPTCWLVVLTSSGGDDDCTLSYGDGKLPDVLDSARCLPEKCKRRFCYKNGKRSQINMGSRDFCHAFFSNNYRGRIRTVPGNMLVKY